MRETSPPLRRSPAAHSRVAAALLAATLLAGSLLGAACERSRSGPGERGGPEAFRRSQSAPADRARSAASRGSAVAPAPVTTPKGPDAPIVLFLGDSLTAGLGLEESQSYPALIQRRIDAAGLPHRVVNAGVSGDTSRGGLARMDWLLKQHPEVIFVALGANDGLRGQNPEETRANLAAIIEKARATEATVVLAGMQLPTNLGPDYTARFAAIFPELARTYDLPLLPFLLEGVAMQRSLNQPDAIHPNVEGAKIVADNVWGVLEKVLKK